MWTCCTNGARTRLIGTYKKKTDEMDKYESSVHLAPASIDRVFAKLSDMSNMQSVQERVADPNFEEQLRARIPADKMPDAEKLKQIRDSIQQMTFTPDSVTMPAGPLGTVTLQVVERENERLVKLAVVGAPVPANVWIQMLPSGAATALKVTVGAEMNFFIRKMVESKLKQAPDGIAQVLCAIPY